MKFKLKINLFLDSDFDCLVNLIVDIAIILRYKLSEISAKIKFNLIVPNKSGNILEKIDFSVYDSRLKFFDSLYQKNIKERNS